LTNSKSHFSATRRLDSQSIRSCNWTSYHIMKLRLFFH